MTFYLLFVCVFDLYFSSVFHDLLVPTGLFVREAVLGTVDLYCRQTILIWLLILYAFLDANKSE